MEPNNCPPVKPQLTGGRRGCYWTEYQFLWCVSVGLTDSTSTEPFNFVTSHVWPGGEGGGGLTLWVDIKVKQLLLLLLIMRKLGMWEERAEVREEGR